MNKLKQVKDISYKIMFILTKKQKIYALFVMLLTLIGAVFETLGVSIIIPFVSSLIDIENFMKNSYVKPICEVLGLNSHNKIIIGLGLSISLIYIIKNLYLTFLSYIRAKFATKMQKEMSVKLMNAYMKREYSFFTETNTSELLQGTNGDISSVYQMLNNALKIFAEFVTALAIIIFIVRTDVVLALSTLLLAGICSGLIFLGFRKPMAKMGYIFRESSRKVNQYGLEAFQGIKEIIVMHKQQYFMERFENATEKRQKAVIGQTVATECPAYIIEAVCVSGLILAVCLRIQSTDTDMAAFIPQLSAFAVAAFRILPSLGRISSCFNQFIYYGVSLEKVYQNFSAVEKSENIIDSTQNIGNKSKNNKKDENSYIDIREITWKYPNDDKLVLENLSLKIQRGEAVALIGQSGAGKTTLADIILGLYRPQKGEVLYQGNSIFDIQEMWCRTIGYIPQTIYLLDDTIRKNVSFGIYENEIDETLIWHALEQAQLKEFVEKLPNKLDTVVGERGVRFSGGQRQRIAIARALYYNPEILILDEATSALDTETESAVMESINILQGKKTLIIVAHRLSTIQNCDKVYEIKNGKAIKVKN